MSLSRMFEVFSRNTINFVSVDCPDEQCERSHADLYADVQVAVKCLKDAGVKSRSKIGILSGNSYRWLVADLALIQMDCISYCFPVEYFRDWKLTELADAYDLNLLLVSDELLRECYPPHISSISLKGALPRSRVECGGAAASELSRDVFTIVFSSGTSGRLKRLMISASGTAYQLELLVGIFEAKPSDRVLAFLPMSIFQQRWMLYAALIYKFDFALTDTFRVLRGLARFKPTILGAPPPFYEYVYNRYLALPPAVQRRTEMLARMIGCLPLGKGVRSALQKRVFRPMFDAFGGRVRVMLIGGAPSKLRMLKLFALLGLPLYEGYGLTEAGYLSLNGPKCNRIGTVGRPLYRDIIEIEDDGEIIARVKHPLCLGYLGDDDAQGGGTFIGPHRIATGDIGVLDREGFLHLNGRKKEIIITSGGYKVHPELLEQELERSVNVRRAVVLGGGEFSSLRVVVSVLKNTPETAQRIERHIQAMNARHPLALRICKTVVTELEFDHKSGFVNRNLKVDRGRVRDFFRSELVS